MCVLLTTKADKRPFSSKSETCRNQFVQHYEPNSPRLEWLLSSKEEKIQFLEQQEALLGQDSPAKGAAEIRFSLMLGLCYEIQFNWATRRWFYDHRTICSFLGKWVSPLFYYLISCFPLFLSRQFQIGFFHDVDEELNKKFDCREICPSSLQV